MTENTPLPDPKANGPIPPGVARKEAALQRLSRLKRGIVVTTLLGFGALGVLASGHRVGATTPAAPPAVTATPAPPADDGGGAFGQGSTGGFFNGGGSGGQGGYGFGNGGAAQPPVAGSGAS